MDIRYLGWQSFRIQEGKQLVLTQPFSEDKTKALFPKVKADLVLQSRNTNNLLRKRVEGAEQDKVFWTPGPGEYEVAGIEVKGFSSGYWFKMKDFQLVFWWDLEIKGVKRLVQDFPNIDILFLKTGRKEKGSAKGIKEVSRKISPAILIPFCDETIVKSEMLSGDWAKVFLDALDQEDIKPQEKLLLSKEEVSSDERKIVLLDSKL